MALESIDGADYPAREGRCPRCGEAAALRFAGPCSRCVAELRARFAALDGRVDVAVEAFEPKLHVTPNAVALKDD